ncbi:PAS domain-containing sensor histidine kinase [Flavitalea sp.]|nr:PAS domain S-box protein [Flavitalea sp.]
MNSFPDIGSPFTSHSSRNTYGGMPITETISNGFFTVDENWTVLSWNKAAEQILGVTGADIIGKNLWEEFVGTLPLNFYVVYHKAFLTDVPLHFREYWPEMSAWFDVITYHVGNKLSVSFKSSSVPAGRIRITAEVQQMRILDELYRYVTEVTNDCLWEWDLPNKQIFWIDGSHKRIFGYNIENALIPQDFWESRIHPEDRLKVKAMLKQFLSYPPSGKEWDIEYRFQRANGEYAYVCDRGHLMYDNDEKPIRMIGATQDITRRKLTEIQLLESEQQLSLIAKQTVNAIIITDVNGHINWVNTAFTNITGYTAEEVMGKKPGSFLQGPDTDPATISYLRNRINQQLPFDCDILNYSKKGRPFWIHLHGQPLFDSRGNCDRYFAMDTDITEKIERQRKSALEKESNLIEMSRAVLAAQENERVVIGREMHDNLNQILGAAKLYIELAKTDESVTSLCLDKASDYILQVIQEIRKLSKAMITPVLVLGLIDSLIILIADLVLPNPIKFKLQVQVKEEQCAEDIKMDLFRIAQEQVNNIIKHSGADVAIIRLSIKANQLVLSFKDNGKGCDPGQQLKGVGILNIKTRVELHGGTMNIITSPGEGYELKVAVPLSNT